MKIAMPHVFASLLLGVTLFAACGDSDSPTTATAPAQTSSTARPGLITIQIADNSFSPANLTVPKGTKVTWAWSGRNPHSVKGTWLNGPVESLQMTGKGAFEFTFEADGTFEYQCGVHGAAMTGRVTVKP